jgi:hypothetical protein
MKILQRGSRVQDEVERVASRDSWRGKGRLAQGDVCGARMPMSLVEEMDGNPMRECAKIRCE